MRIVEHVWTQFAVNGPGIAAGDERRWRVFIGQNPIALPVLSCEVAGHCIPDVNWKTETTSDGEPDHRGLRGWISVFGTVSITDKEQAIIQLEDSRVATS